MDSATCLAREIDLNGLDANILRARHCGVAVKFCLSLERGVQDRGFSRNVEGL